MSLRIGYNCKYAPVELLAAFDCELVALTGECDGRCAESDAGDWLADASGAAGADGSAGGRADGAGGTAAVPADSATSIPAGDALIHPNLCAYAKVLYEAAHGCDLVLLTDCCDSVRRVGDVLAAEERPAVLMLELPHWRDACMRERFGDVIARMVERLRELTGKSPDGKRFLGAWRDVSDAGPKADGAPDAGERPRPGAPYCALLGARMSPGMLEQIREALPLPLVDFTCQGPRHFAPPPADVDVDDDADLAVDDGALLRAYASALLDQRPCLRMADVASRRALTEDPALAAVVYSTVKFCDFYPFEYAALTGELGTPIVRIESEYEPRASEQVLTRIAALSETLAPQGDGASAASTGSIDAGSTSAGASLNSAATHSATADPTAAELSLARSGASSAGTVSASTEERMSPPMTETFVAGIDSGSTSTNVVVLDEAGAVRASAIVRTGAKAQRSAEAALAEAASALGIGVGDFRAIVATGYGRNHLDCATRSVTEISCHAKGAHRLHPEVRTIIDIGGQDSKVIVLDEAGRVETFAMNDKCAAGTGRFFEAMARTLELDLETMAAMTDFHHDLTLSSLCTVFAESEVIGLIADNCETADIVHGLNRAVATRTEGLLRRTGGHGPYLMTGGVGRNRGLVAELSRKLGEPLTVAESPDMVGALGAALYAL